MRILKPIFAALLLIAFTLELSAQTEDGVYAKITTNRGTILIKLFYKEAPLTVCNFVGLAEGKITNTAKPAGVPFYDGIKCHRVISIANGDGQDFMVQAGDPLGNGTGGPGYSFADEFAPGLKHDAPGYLSMANSGPATNGSQFFITIVPTPWLDGKHSIFGKVVEGQTIVNTSKTNDIIESVKIIRKGKDAEKFVADQAQFEKLKEICGLKEAEAKVAKQKQTAMEKANAEKEFTTWVTKNYPKALKTNSGLYYVIDSAGTGEKAVAGKKVSVHYKGMLTNGQIFDESYARKEPISFTLGIGAVIPGWDEGIALMKVGDKFKLLIPSDLGYGERGAGGVIPPNASLIFETELMSVE
ncbi:MAG: peptidylprolyl isomerase [Bacteroidia bacterium]